MSESASGHPAEGRIRTNPAGGSANEQPTAKQKNPAAVTELSEGPSVGPRLNDANGAYLPASYRTRSGNIRSDS